MTKSSITNITNKCMNVKPSICIISIICLTILGAIYIMQEKAVQLKAQDVELKAKEVDLGKVNVELKAKDIELETKKVEALVISRTEIKDSYIICMQTASQNIQNVTLAEVQETCKEFKQKSK